MTDCRWAVMAADAAAVSPATMASTIAACWSTDSFGRPGMSARAVLMVRGAIAQVRHQLGGDDMAAHFPESPMQNTVQLGVVAAPVLGNSRSHVVDDPPQLGVVVRGCCSGGLGGDQTFERRSGFGDLDGLGDRDSAHGCTSVDLSLDESLRRQRHQS